MGFACVVGRYVSTWETACEIPPLFFGVNLYSMTLLKNLFFSPKKKPYLTQREKQVLELMCQGMTYKAIGSELGIKERTASKHGSNILKKFRVESKLQLFDLLDSYDKSWVGRVRSVISTHFLRS